MYALVARVVFSGELGGCAARCLVEFTEKTCAMGSKPLSSMEYGGCVARG
jgi:hypothetical protein